jgi:hypothetical protein
MLTKIHQDNQMEWELVAELAYKVLEPDLETAAKLELE